MGPDARRRRLLEWMKLAGALGDIGQTPKVQDLTKGEGTDRDG